MYENKKILIVGAAKSGIAVAKLLAGRNNDITLTDQKELKAADKNMLESLGIKVVITENQSDLITNDFDLAIKNPGIMPSRPVIQKINELNIRLENELEVAYHFLPKNITIIGVTGSNGKTTTTTLIYEFLTRLGQNVILGGNIGYPLCAVIDQVKAGDILLLEISDHQLYDMHDFKTNISVLTNLCPTHLDYHGTYESYKNTKKKIFNHHTDRDIAIINKQNPDSLSITQDIKSHKIYFNDAENYYQDDYIYLHGEKYLCVLDFKLKGIHNYENIIAALLVVEKFGLNQDIIREFLKNFGGVEHRIEYVTTKNGIEYYNDSKSTNPTATITALKTFPDKPVHLILGGLNRNQEFSPLNAYLKNVVAIYAIGEVTEQVFDYAKSQNKPCIQCYTLKDAMKNIKKSAQSGDVVLLSPGSASQDQYEKFEDRGREFKELINNEENI